MTGVARTGGDCGRRVVSEGSWFAKPWNLRSATRHGVYTGVRDYVLGFRHAQDF